MKKEYIKPTILAYDIKMAQVVCASGDIPLGAPEFDFDFDNANKFEFDDDLINDATFFSDNELS